MWVMPRPRPPARVAAMPENAAPVTIAPPVAPEPAPPQPPAPPLAEPQRRKFKFPTAFTVLAAVLLLVWIASFFVPPGVYSKDPATASPVPGSYHKLPSCSSAAAGVACA